MKINVEKRKENMFLQMKNNNPLQSILTHPVAATFFVSILDVFFLNLINLN